MLSTPMYDKKTRGADVPEYSEAEEQYRTDILRGLQLAYNIREQPQMELNDKPYSLSYLTNRQQGMAYNPPILNPTDSRISTGITHEKLSTGQQIIVDMNFQPKFQSLDEDDDETIELAAFCTARVKRALRKEVFQPKIADFAWLNMEQGNVFISFERTVKYNTKKVMLNDTPFPAQKRWKTVREVEDELCESIAIPNTAVYMPNLLENDMHKQPRIWAVVHVPRSTAEGMFGRFPNWKYVPKFPTNTVPPNTNGLWGDFYLQQPQKDYVEIIITQSECENDYNALVNSVLMYPVQMEGDKISGYPLTEKSPSGCYTLVKGTNEKIPFYAYGRAWTTKNEVKEEVANEFLRIAVHKFRYSAFPSVGNNSDKVLPASVWNPSEVIPDLDATKVNVLNPNGFLTPADFSFYQMVMQSIDESTISQAQEGTGDQKVSATQYVGDKKESLKKFGITLDGAVNLLQELYWLYLWSDVEYLDKKVRKYSAQTQEYTEEYDSFISDETLDGVPGKVHYHLQDDLEGLDPNQMFMDEQKEVNPTRHVYMNPSKVKDMIKKMKNKLYCIVSSEPEGQNQSLLSILFNLLMQYGQLRGAPIPNLNYEYLDKVIGQNSGFEVDKIFTQLPPPQIMPQQIGPDGQPIPGPAVIPGIPTQPKKPQNATLANAT